MQKKTVQKNHFRKEHGTGKEIALLWLIQIGKMDSQTIRMDNKIALNSRIMDIGMMKTAMIIIDQSVKNLLHLLLYPILHLVLQQLVSEKLFFTTHCQNVCKLIRILLFSCVVIFSTNRMSFKWLVSCHRCRVFSFWYRSWRSILVWSRTVLQKSWKWRLACRDTKWCYSSIAPRIQYT